MEYGELSFCFDEVENVDANNYSQVLFRLIRILRKIRPDFCRLRTYELKAGFISN